MTPFEKKIINAFISRYLASVRAVSPNAENAGVKHVMRLRSVSIFPGFDAARPDEKESYLDAAESLERKGLLSLNWEKRGIGERLKTLTCGNTEKLFEVSGKKNPGVETKKIKLMLAEKISVLEKMALAKDVENENCQSQAAVSFLKYLAEYAGAAEIRRTLDFKSAEDFARLMEFFIRQENLRSLSTRALSIQLYSDSKRLEQILELAGSLTAVIQKNGDPVPSLSFPERSFPETMISGKLAFEFAPNGNKALKPMVNAAGIILGFPLASVLEIQNIKTIAPKKNPSVLTIENKETFYAIGGTQNHNYDCCLYTSGYPNQAVSAIIKLLAANGFCFFHAGDLDPDGILILQNIRDIAEKPVVPVRMDAKTFDCYLPWSRALNKDMLRQTTRIREDTKAIPELADLIRRIEETKQGVEQEVIDYFLLLPNIHPAQMP